MSPNSKGKQDSGVAEDGGSKQDKAPKAHLVTWKYDDDRTIGGVLKGNEGYFHPTLLKSELDLNKEISWLKRQEENKRLRLRPFKEIDLPIGVEAFSEDYHEFSIGNPTITRKHFDEFRKMTDARDQEACGALMQIVSAILSSYVVRLIGEANFAIDEFVEECVRPLNVHVSAATNVTYTLHELIEAMVVDTAVDEENNLRLRSAKIFPAPGTSAKKMLDTAYMGFKGYKEYVWPMPYRDTAVLIDRNYISPAEIKAFLTRNPWCACIIYGSKVALPVGSPIEVKGSALSRINDLFDRKAVQALVAAYVAEVPKLFEMGERWFTPIWKEAGERLSTYQTVRDLRMNRESRFMSRLQIFSVLAFFWFIARRCAVSKEEMEEFTRKRLNAIFPGCMPESISASLDDPMTMSPEDALERVLETMLREENIGHFYFVPQKRGAIWPMLTEKGAPVWGYVKCYDWERNGGLTPCLVLPRENLLEFARVHVPGIVEFPEALAAFQTKRPDYMHSTLNARIRYPGEEKSSIRMAYRLRIDALPVQARERHRLMILAL